MLVQLEATPTLLGHAPNRLGVQYYSSTLKSHIKHLRGRGRGSKVWVVTCSTLNDNQN